MKKFLLLLVGLYVSTPTSADAGYKCQEVDGAASLEVAFLQAGAAAILISNEVSAYYAAQGFNIQTIETVRDNAGFYLSFKAADGLQFLTYAPNSNSSASWGLSFLKGASLEGIKVQLSDQSSGKTFDFTMNCENTSGLIH